MSRLRPRAARLGGAKLHRAAVAYQAACGRKPDEHGLQAALEAADRDAISPARAGFPAYQPGDVLEADHALAVVRYVRPDPEAVIFLDAINGQSASGYLGGSCHDRVWKEWGRPIGHMRFQGAWKLYRRAMQQKTRP